MSNYDIVRNVTRALVAILQNDLDAALGPSVAAAVAAPPEKAAGVTGPTVIVYLYQALESPTLKNAGPRTTGITSGGGAQSATVLREPLALDLYFLLIPVAPVEPELTFLDTYNVLGVAARSMHDRGIFTLGQWVTDAPAEDVANEYRVSFNPLSTGELFELWESVHEPYRLSLSYVVRTVRIDSGLSSEVRLVSERALSVDHLD